MASTVIGHDWGESLTNLQLGVQLAVYHPLVAAMSCDDCEKYLHNDWKISYRADQPNLRLNLKVSPTPCYKCPKIPLGVRPSRWTAVELSPRNRLAWHHYLECAAVSYFPDDPIVRLHARIMRQIIDAKGEHTTERRHRELAETILAAVMRQASG